jgi:hypothetical protein
LYGARSHAVRLVLWEERGGGDEDIRVGRGRGIVGRELDKVGLGEILERQG